MWQEIIVGLCVLGALVFLLRRWLPGGQRKSASCGSGCGGCDSANTSKSCSTENMKPTSSR
jgi:hypothetical protein